MFVHHPEIAREFESKTKSIKSLPEHVKKKEKMTGRQSPKDIRKSILKSY